jgi:hypothetical protein
MYCIKKVSRNLKFFLITEFKIIRFKKWKNFLLSLTQDLDLVRIPTPDADLQTPLYPNPIRNHNPGLNFEVVNTNFVPEKILLTHSELKYHI